MALTSEQRAEINRANAARSTGPRSAEGKAAASRNALTHGLTARVFAVVPGEDPAEHAAFVAEWADDYRPATAGRRALVERAADAAWKLRRLALAGESQAARVASQAESAHHVDQIARAEALGDRLRADTPDAPALPRGGVRGGGRGRGRSARPVERAHPRAINAELETFLEGVRWKLARWRELEGLLIVDGYWEWDAKFLAVRLLGARPEDAMLDPIVRGIFRCCRSLHPSDDTLGRDADQAALGWPDRAVATYRAGELSEVAMPMKEARERLRTIARQEQVRLDALRPAMEEQESFDRAEAPLRALADSAAVAAPLRRYETTLDRTLRQCVHALETLPGPSGVAEWPGFAAETQADAGPEPIAPPCPSAPAEPRPEPAPAAPTATAAKPTEAATPPRLAPPSLQPRRNEANPTVVAPRPTPPPTHPPRPSEAA